MLFPLNVAILAPIQPHLEIMNITWAQIEDKTQQKCLSCQVILLNHKSNSLNITAKNLIGVNYGVVYIARIAIVVTQRVHRAFIVAI